MNPITKKPKPKKELNPESQKCYVCLQKLSLLPGIFFVQIISAANGLQNDRLAKNIEASGGDLTKRKS